MPPSGFSPKRALRVTQPLQTYWRSVWQPDYRSKLLCFRLVALRPPLSESLPLILLFYSSLIIGIYIKNFRDLLKKFCHKKGRRGNGGKERIFNFAMKLICVTIFVEY